jgi:hypothetical protein
LQLRKPNPAVYFQGLLYNKRSNGSYDSRSHCLRDFQEFGV